jgi:thiol-disulfide isomerase/thioredoxin
MHALLTLIFTLALLPVQADTKDAKNPVAIGTQLDNLTFKDTRFLPRSLNDFKEKKAFVLVFTNTTCPLVQRYLPMLQRLEKEYRAKGVQFLAVNVSEEDSILQMATQQVQYGMEMPFVKDNRGVCAKKLGVLRTPEAVILDADRRLRYRGRIDDQYRLGGMRPEASRNDLQLALEEVLAGKTVTTAETPVDGCLITFTEPSQPKEALTYAEHVAPIVRKHCVECHRPNTPAPFSLLTYEQVANKAQMIAEVTHEQRMPPWYASPDFGAFSNKRGLSEKERETIQHWLVSGKQRGDESKLPPLPDEIVKPKTTWAIGEPDLVLETPEYSLPAEGTVPYQYVVLKHVFTEDTWVQGVQIRPKTNKTVHHANLAYFKLGESFRLSNFITGYVPGGEPMTLKDGIGFLVPKGMMLLLQIHYVTNGQPEKGQVEVGIKFAKETIQKRMRFHLFVDHRFAIPPGAPAHPVAASRTFQEDIEGVGLFAHMHVRGRDMTFRITRPGQPTETLLMIPNYNFDWQMPYRWAPGTMTFPKGTRIDCLAHYDNSPFNPFNPNPKATVRDGQQTADEMMNGFFFYTHQHEQLNLRIDPKTGRVLPPQKVGG